MAPSWKSGEKAPTYPLQGTNPQSQLLTHSMERQSKDNGLERLSWTNKSEKKALFFFYFWDGGIEVSLLGPEFAFSVSSLSKLIEPVTETLVHAEEFSAAHSAQQ